MFDTLENTPLEIDLVAQAPTTGWSGSGDIATHDICNAGSTYLKPPNGLVITEGHTYTFSYFVNSISGGYVQPFMGDTAGDQLTSAQFKTETLIATGTDLRFRFFSNAQCEIELFAIRDVATITSLKQRNTIAYNEKINRWTSFYTYIPDCGFGLFIKLYTLNRGNIYVNSQDNNRNEFYGVQYASILKFVCSQFPTIVKNFQTLSYQSNQLMITTEDGITTNLGQVSDLAAEDFLNYSLVDGVTTINVYDREGLYQASIRRNKLSGGILNGDTLRGNYLTVEIISTEDTVLELFTTSVQSSISKVGIR